MSVGVLGPLLTDNGPLSPRERSVLSALVLRSGFPVSPHELADAVWGDDPPGTWPKQVQHAVSLLRRALGSRLIRTGPGGYTIVLDPDSVDARRFDRLVEAARAHADDGDPARAIDALDRALELWRGAPYPDLPEWPPAVVESARLSEVRVEAEELLLRCRLALGGHASVIAGAERLVREQPLREQRWVLLATALYRNGRQADALAAIRSARQRLAEELGIEPGEELRGLELAILRHDSVLDVGEPPATPSDACPYHGLTAFGVDDEEDFFGRGEDIGAALDRLAHSPFLAVTGASGSGKSSLVRAGLVPVLRRRGDRVVILTPSAKLGAAVRDAMAGARRAPVVVVVDQFEELFHTGAGTHDVDDVAHALAEAIEQGASIILVVRSDFLDDCAAQPELRRLFSAGVHLVGPMSPENLRAAIEQPARRAGLRLEPGLSELILRDATGGSGSLPHVSHALVETWLRREGGTLTVAGYEASGGISGAIAQSADRLYQSMDARQRALCRSTLARLVALAPDGSPVRRRVPSRALRADPSRDEVLALLADARLVSTEADSLAVAHESIATAWPRLHAWLEEDAEGTRLLASLSLAAEAWDADGRPDEDLYRGGRLQAVREWREAEPRDLTDTESAFLAASSARETSEQEALAERARHDRRQNRRLRSTLAMAAGLIVLLVGAGSVAMVSSREASAQRDSATIEGLVGMALALRDSERDVSALLAAEAYRRWPDDPRTRSGLMGVLQGAGGFLGNAFMPGVNHAYGAVIPGTEQALVVTVDGELAIRDLETAQVARDLDLGFQADVNGPILVAVSGDGRVGAVLWSTESVEIPGQLIGVASASQLVVVELASGRHLVGPTPLDIGAGALALDRTGSIVAVAAARDGAVTLVSTDSGERRPIAGDRPIPLDRDTLAVAMTFDPAGRLIVGRLGTSLDVIDPASARVVDSIVVPEGSAHQAIDVTPSGRIVAAGDKELIAVDAAAKRVVWSRELGGQTYGPCYWLAVSEPHDRIYCGNRYGRITVFVLEDGRATGESLDSLLGDVGTMEVSPDGAVLTTISGTEAAISRWSLDGGGAAHRLVAPGATAVGGYSFEGSSIVVAPPHPGSISESPWVGAAVVDTRTGAQTYELDGAVNAVGWAAGRRLIANYPDDLAFRVVDPDRGAPIGEPLDLHRYWVDLDGAVIHAMDPEGRIVDLDSADLEPVGDPLAFDGWPIWFAKSPDGRRIAVTYFGESALAPDGTPVSTHVTIIDGDDGQVVEDRALFIGGTVILDDGRLIGLEDNRIGWYETDTLDRTGSLPGAAGGLGIPALSTDARTLLISAADGSTMLYDLPSGTRIGEPLHADPATPLAEHLRPDGMELALSMPEGVVVWDLDPEHQFDAVCRVAGRDLTADEWRTYLSDLGEPQSTCGFDSAD
ncbi:DNA-binding SARP family transcriptional activator [Agromyces flavus]|uniref:DNA-binding SARP family transcriptional activator n=1 Tax=Agromyces flavus TaxID=589382 RepID=A0A1H1PGF2_9MICO|nr:BTAD domain-containing putative transcriptional regulator [Agromyces flavus]MCP2367925.1 DNA-binding SARP family transcriptional activator [Agromyces flavus]GGI47387.1 hypothetical protein GCM10010932_20750 [Agromyces flavus]SDS10322.1 DNA-binding transcriptional activator of the SARP family [Agromyces flavus]